MLKVCVKQWTRQSLQPSGLIKYQADIHNCILNTSLFYTNDTWSDIPKMLHGTAVFIAAGLLSPHWHCRNIYLNSRMPAASLEVGNDPLKYKLHMLSQVAQAIQEIPWCQGNTTRVWHSGGINKNKTADCTESWCFLIHTFLN